MTRKLDLTQFEVTDNKVFSQFEIKIGEHLAKIEYSNKSGKIFLISTEVPEELSGQGIASYLAKEAFKIIEKDRLTVVPMCGFIKAFIRKHPDYLELVAPGIQLH